MLGIVLIKDDKIIYIFNCYMTKFSATNSLKDLDNLKFKTTLIRKAFKNLLPIPNTYSIGKGNYLKEKNKLMRQKISGFFGFFL